MQTPKDKSAAGHERAVYVEKQIVKRNQVNPIATDEQSQQYWSKYHAQSAEK
jgi:hypothetical protein